MTGDSGPRKVQSVGDSVGITLPAEALKQLDASKGDYVWLDASSYPVELRTVSEGARHD